ncbi:hypothetical protein TL16_g04482 [Triparma laevis f. inornata]|uniref:Uncharacterized protein n=1 Tax=Triparma laevis f. inornata TaxID=1714386 RepID=A0A9W7ACE8_9STRA|nr:hypothetical protein TL16_g04482 [Triparma laevis f. inornata]
MLNDFLHWSPIADAVVYTVFWSFFALLSAVCAPIYLIFLRFPFVIVEQSYRNVASLASTPPDADHIIVVTGCDTGFGYDLALKFLRTSKKQFTVFAYCYSDAGCKRVNSLNSDSNPNQVIAVKCDVTDEEAVVSAATNVRIYLSQPSDIRRVFHGLINNAGVGSPGTIDMIPVMQSPGKPFSYQRDIEVNYYGALRVTKSLLPIFKAQFKESGEKTSLINVTSMAGLVPSPFMSAYAGSKHALEAASTCMRNELCTFGINVCTVNPSFHGTPLVDGIGDGVEALWQSLEGGYGVGWFSAMKIKSIQGEKGLLRGRSPARSETLHNSYSLTPGSKASEWRAHNVTEICFRTSLYKESGQRMVGTDAKYLLASLRHLPRSIQDFMVSGHPFAPFYVGGNVEV